MRSGLADLLHAAARDVGTSTGLITCASNGTLERMLVALFAERVLDARPGSQSLAPPGPRGHVRIP